MKKLIHTKGFTLIELLVVITIIGILATGATTVYITAQQKARDSVRQGDILALQGALVQSYSDNNVYPIPTGALASLATANYIGAIPKDPKTGQKDAATSFEYAYAAGDNAGIAGQTYELSANFENTTTATAKEAAASDGGDDDNRWEMGLDVITLDTSFTAGTQAISVQNDYGAVATAAVTL